MTGIPDTIRQTRARRSWRRLGMLAVLGSGLAVLGVAAAPVPTPDEARTIGNPAGPSILAAPSARSPLAAPEAGSGQPLTALDRGGDDLARVYRSLNDLR